MKVHTIPLNLADLDGGTLGLDALEFGVYVRLIFACYRTEDHSIPNDEIQLSRIAGTGLKSFRRAWPKFAHKFEVVEDRLINRRTLAEVSKMQSKSSVASVNALKSWEIRKAKALQKQSEGKAIQDTRYNIQDSIAPLHRESPAARPASRGVEGEEFFRSVYDAGSEAFPNLATRRTAVIAKWEEAGATIRDALPEIERAKVNGVDVRSWEYFTAGIMSAKATRLSVMPEGKARPGAKKDFDLKHMEAAAAAVGRLEGRDE